MIRRNEILDHNLITEHYTTVTEMNKKQNDAINDKK